MVYSVLKLSHYLLRLMMQMKLNEVSKGQMCNETTTHKQQKLMRNVQIKTLHTSHTSLRQEDRNCTSK